MSNIEGVYQLKDGNIIQKVTKDELIKIKQGIVKELEKIKSELIKYQNITQTKITTLQYQISEINNLLEIPGVE